jgi:DNA (cytosine-5)-methyltransferase 1
MARPLAYYNENDRFAAAWLRELIAAGLIAPGDVDERSIEDVRPADLDGYCQCHFFAGIGGWSAALRLAGWPDDRAAWTGSCPCQPLSSAGLRKGHADKRHLWPTFYGLIAECDPPKVFGEQVASKDGREWFAGVRADLEDLGYACGAADLCSACAGSPDIRQRLYWVADAESERCGEARECFPGPAQWPCPSGTSDRIAPMAYGEGERRNGGAGASGKDRRHFLEAGSSPRRLETLGDAQGTGLEGQWGEYRPSGERHCGLVGFAMQAGVPQWNGPTVAVKCSDGARRVSAQPNAFPLAHGVSARVGVLRGSGNAINPILASEFIRAADLAMSEG